MKKQIKKYRIHLFSNETGKYAPTQHPLQDTPQAARQYGRDHLKLPENLAGQHPFTVEPEYV